MAMMMAQQSGEREAREVEHRLRHEEMVAQHEESRLAMERETALHCEEMAMQCEENRAQHQMMSIMLMAMMQNNSTMSGMIGNLEAFLGHQWAISWPPPQDRERKKMVVNQQMMEGPIR
jgi:hypothetical protein